MARTSTPWALLPVGEFGCGSATTCWRRFSEWAHAGVFERLQEDLLDELGQAGALDWSRISVDSFSLRATRGDQVGANPVDRAKPGVQAAPGGRRRRAAPVATGHRSQHPRQHHVRGAAGRHPPVGTPAGRRRRRPEKVHADKPYDHRRCRGYLSERGIKLRIARCGIESSQRLGRHRWKAERTIAWLAGCRRLRVRYDRSSERFFAFVLLASDRLCYNRLPCAATARSP